MRNNILQSCLLSLSIIAVILLVGCNSDQSSNGYGSPPPPPPPRNSNTVVMSGSRFSPATLTITAGTTVTWQNNDSYVHTSTSDASIWNTGDIPGGESKTTTFSTAGTYTYHCIYHSAMGMVGTIVVH